MRSSSRTSRPDLYPKRLLRRRRIPACGTIKSQRGGLIPKGEYRTIISQDKREETSTAGSGEPEAEGALVARAKNGSEEAWSAIYEANFRPIHRYVSARVFDEGSAADIASSVFVAAISGIRTYTYRGRPLLAWLYRIAFSLVGDYQRKTMRERQRFMRLPDWVGGTGSAGEAVSSGAGAGPTGDPAEMISDLDLRAAIRELPGDQRDVLILRFFVGLSTPEIAQVMDRQPVAVYSLQARAVAALRKVLE